MKGIILTTHGDFATGLYSTVKMIAGEFENIRIVEFHDGDDLDEFDKRLEEAYNRLSYDDVVVLTDLAGGTPFNRSVMTLSSKGNVEFLAGVNFAMLYQALSSEIEDRKEFIEDVMDVAKESVTSYQINESTEEEDSDGI